MAIADRIRELRKENEWTQQELANRIQIHSVNIARLEKGKANPSADTLIKLSETFNVSSDYLLFGDTNKREPITMKDKDLLEAFEVVSKMDNHAKNVIKELLQAFIMKQKISQMM